MKKITKNNISYYVFEHIQQTGLCTHCFTTRQGGVSAGCYAALNMSLHRDDDPAAIRANYGLVCDTLGFKLDNIVVADQYHTNNIYIATMADCGHDFFKSRKLAHVDGLITAERGPTLLTYYADCVPLLFLDKALGVIANVHSGWRGVVNNIAAAAVGRMISGFGSRPADILVGIGPHIGQAAFEVMDDVADEFTSKLDFAHEFITKRGKFHVDLCGVITRCLTDIGIPPDNIEASNVCTFENESEFFSHRRDGLQRGGMALIATLKEQNENY